MWVRKRLEAEWNVLGEWKGVVDVILRVVLG